MLKGIDQPKPPSHQQQHEVQRSAPALALGADQVGQREQQSQPQNTKAPAISQAAKLLH